MSRIRHLLLASVFAPLAIAACTSGSNSNPTSDGGSEASTDASEDGTVDSAPEAAVEAGAEATAEAAVEASTVDSGSDAQDAALSEASSDATPEASAEAEAGPPTPTAVVSDAPNPTALAADGTNLYWIDSIATDAGTLGRVMSVPATGGTEVTLATTPGVAIASLAIDTLNVYYTDAANNVWQVAKAAGSPVKLVTSDESGPLGTSGGVVYFGQTGGVSKVALTDGGVVGQSLATSGNPVDLVVVAGDVFWANPAAGQLQYVSASAGGTPTTLLGPDPEAGTGEYVSTTTSQNLITDGTSLYWNRAPSGSYPGAIMTISVGGGAPSVVVNTGTATPLSVVTDGNSVYYLLQGATTSLVQASLAGSPNVLTTSDLGAAIIAGTGPTVAVDANNVYWLNPPQIFSLPK
jgi:hypothetical protein